MGIGVYALALLVVSIGLFSGCATVAQGPSFSEAPAPTPDPGKAVVYVFRKYAEPTAWGATIYFDKHEVATLNQSGFTWAYLVPGKHTVRGVWAGMSGQKDSSISLDVKSGQSYFIELTGSSRLTGSKAGTTPGSVIMYFRMGSGLNEVNPAAGRSILTQCCKFQQPLSSQY